MSEEMKRLESECAACRRCALGTTRTNLVFGVGKVPSELMFVGEGPGEQEDLQGEPFVGPAGKLLARLPPLAGRPVRPGAAEDRGVPGAYRRLAADPPRLSHHP